MFLSADEDNLGLSYLCKPAEPSTGAGAAEGQPGGMKRAWGDERFVNLLFLQKAGKAALPGETGVTKPCREKPKSFFKKIILFLN